MLRNGVEGTENLIGQFDAQPEFPPNSNEPDEANELEEPQWVGVCVGTRVAKLDVIESLPGPLVGADIVELNPDRDLVDMTAMVAAKLVKEITAAMLQRS